MSDLTIKEMKDVVRHTISNNQVIQKKGMKPIAMEIKGDSGIGKTSLVMQVGEELNLPVVKLNLAQIEELGDLVGFPVKQFEMVGKAGETDWIDEHAIDEFATLGWKFTKNKRMSYCPPEWIAGKPAGGILFLDDWNRADMRFTQATMELIDRQQYISWKLPENWHIILSANPDNGDYTVNTLDQAQLTRFISLNLKFNIRDWAEWAEETGIDGRCINFLLKHPELVTTKTNPRSISNFFNSIYSIPVFEDKLPTIRLMGEGSVGDAFSTLFVTFINNKLDKLISPEDIIFKGEQHVMSALKAAVGNKDKYRADIANIMGTRIVNYVLYYAKDNTITKEIIDRLVALISEDIFTNDMKFIIAKDVFYGNRIKFKTLMLNDEVRKYILKP